MDMFTQIDLMGRGGSIALLLLWSWILIRDHRAELSARLGVLMNVAIICYLVLTASAPTERSVFGLILALGAGATPGLFWLFARAWFNDEKTVSRRGVALVGLSMLNTLVMQLSFPSHGLTNDIAGAMFRISMLCFAGAAFWEVWRSRDGDLIEERRKIRPRLVAAVASCVVLIACAEVAAHNGFGANSSLVGHSLVRIIGSPIVIIVFVFCAAMLGMRHSNLFGAAHGKLKAPPAFAQDDPLVQKLRNHMTSELPHRDETMSIAKLATQLGEQE